MTRRRRIITLAVVAAVAVTAGVGLWVRSERAEPVGADTRTVQAGEVTVTMTPLALDASGARFRIVLDTHSGALTLDLAQAAQLRLDGQVAPAGTWDGAAPGGHHRDGTLTFTTTVPASASVELRITGLTTEVVGTWTAP